jgi:hypothetical protein
LPETNGDGSIVPERLSHRSLGDQETFFGFSGLATLLD